MPRKSDPVTPTPRYCQVAIDSLVPDPANPRAHGERDIDFLVRSISENGHVLPLLVQKRSRMVIAGNGQLEALKRMGRTKVWIAEIDVDDATARRLSVTLNRSAELSSWDAGALSRAIEEIGDAGWGLDAVGFTDDELDGLIRRGMSEAESLVEDSSKRKNPQGKAEDATPVPIDAQFKIVLTCADEAAQTALLEEFTTRGLECRALIA